MAIVKFPQQQGTSIGKRLDEMDFTSGGPHADINGTAGRPLEEWPWDKELGKPHGDVHGDITRALIPVIDDKINHPIHYMHLPVECIEVTEHMSFCLGNVVKYVYRCNLKGGVEDLKKAKWYLEREIARREHGTKENSVDDYHGC